ncbi:MAG: hypothetical protein SFZ02_12300 [bacterium]|nr:hypothetical protein [bacterium]
MTITFKPLPPLDFEAIKERLNITAPEGVKYDVSTYESLRGKDNYLVQVYLYVSIGEKDYHDSTFIGAETLHELGKKLNVWLDEKIVEYVEEATE